MGAAQVGSTEAATGVGSGAGSGVEREAVTEEDIGSGTDVLVSTASVNSRPLTLTAQLSDPPLQDPLRPSLDPTGIGKVLVLGGGYTGRRFAAALQARGVEVRLTHRRPPRDQDQTLPWLPFDPQAGLLPNRDDLDGTTHLLVTIPPDESGNDPVLGHLIHHLTSLPLSWVGYLSTTGVYGDRGGAWVDEATPVAPGLGRSQARLGCERAWLATGMPLQVFRLPAIYGPGRTPFESLLGGTARLIHKPGQVFSRVHVDDIVGALLHCLALPAAERPAELIVADEAPCPSSETLGYAAHLLGCRLPEVQPYQRIAAGMGAMARSFWSENRRASSRLLRETLGYQLRFPTYREGYRSCLSFLKLPSGSGSARNGRLRS
jgi:nucleoside-diphosphate-sugar epimerase